LYLGYFSSSQGNIRNYIGRTQWWDSSVAANNVDYVGIMDDVYLYDIALTAAEITQIQTNTGTGLKPVTYNALSVFPNPVQRNADVQINCNFALNELQNTRIEVVNSLGEIVEITRPTTLNVYLKGLSQSGVYLIRAVSGLSNIYTAKLLVK
jgi:hypothetical protein